MRMAMTGLVMAGVLAVGIPRAASAFDITGSWTGKWKCAVFSDGAKSVASNPDSTAAITQAGNVFGATIDGELAYAGIAIPDAGKPDKGAVGVIHCGTGDALATQGAYSEFGNWKVSTKDDKGMLSGLTIWSSGAQHIATCKYKYKRVDTADPAVPTACP